jgi:hypothetical protein
VYVKASLAGKAHAATTGVGRISTGNGVGAEGGRWSAGKVDSRVISGTTAMRFGFGWGATERTGATGRGSARSRKTGEVIGGTTGATIALE